MAAAAPIVAPTTAPPPPADKVVRKPATLKDVAAIDWIKGYARYLKRSGKVDIPHFADLVKTGHGKELGPIDNDWFFIRTAAVARKIYLRNNGIGSLKRAFGTGKRRGTIRKTYTTGSGAVIRASLKALEALKVIEKVPKGKGRRVTKTGQRDLDRIANQIINGPVVKKQ